MGTNTYKLASHVKITLSWKSSANKKAMLDLSAFMLDDDGLLQGLDSVVFYGSQINGNGQYHCLDGSILLNSHKQSNGVIRQLMQVDLERMASNIRTIALVISLDSNNPKSKFSSAEVSIEHEKGMVCRLPIDYVNEDAVGGIIVGTIFRYGESWRYENEESTFVGGLENPYFRWVSPEIKEKAVSLNKKDLHKLHEREGEKGTRVNSKSVEVFDVHNTDSVSQNKKKSSFGTMPKVKKDTKGKPTSKQTRSERNEKRNKLPVAQNTETETISAKTTAKEDFPKTKHKKKGGARGVMPFKNNHK